MLSPTYLTPDYRYTGDDWSGANALAYVVYSVAPVYAPDVNGLPQDGTNGAPAVLVSGTGVPMNLTGYSALGTIEYRPTLATVARRFGKSVPFYALPAPTGAVVDAVNGRVTLSLPRSATNVPPQSVQDWGAPELSRLIARPQIVDALGNRITVGQQALFVF